MDAECTGVLPIPPGNGERARTASQLEDDDRQAFVAARTGCGELPTITPSKFRKSNQGIYNLPVLAGSQIVHRDRHCPPATL
jgi:hypothetical protein